MAGRGPAPKAPERRARRNSDTIPTTELKLIRSPAPKLPRLREHGRYVKWNPRTVEWWQTWIDSQLSRDFTATDWQFLLDTALLHHAYWSGELKFGAELRVRVAKFGATPEDRARLRIIFAEADERDPSGPKRPGSSARQRYGQPRAVASS